MTNWFIDGLYEDVVLHRCAYCHKIIWWGEQKRRNRFDHSIFTHSKGEWRQDKWPIYFVESEDSCTWRCVFNK